MKRRKDRFYEKVLVFLDGTRVGIRPKYLLQVVLVIGAAHFCSKFASAKLTSNVEQDDVQFLTLLNLDWL